MAHGISRITCSSFVDGRRGSPQQIWSSPIPPFRCNSRVYLFNTSEEVGRDVGNSLGHFIEMDKRACQSDQALFMRIRVELPIDKPLRRGGNMVSLDGEKFWVNFKYERLPTFCFLCGKLGHDDKHCLEFPNWQNTPKQYGEWLRTGGCFQRELR